MEARRAPGDALGGAGEIQTKFAPRSSLRIAIAAAALAVAVAIAALLTLAGWSSALAMSLAWAGVAALVGGLAQVRSYMFPSGLTAIGVATLIEVLEGALPARVTPLLGGGLLACAELGYWSFELRANVSQSTIEIARRGAVIAVLVVLGAGISGLGVSAFEHLSSRG